ncbi:hypothetical protein [Mycobacterium sp.]|uniref:hypothetical protein n=1 Tax=Mycobacterium sp. TaxID=1785 RepID=UPI003A8C439C
MTGPHSDVDGAKQVSVAELLARNGAAGEPTITHRRRRRRGDSNAVTVAELTGEIPVIRDHPREVPAQTPPPEPVGDEVPAAAEPAGEPAPEPSAIEPEPPAESSSPAEAPAEPPAEAPADPPAEAEVKPDYREGAESRWPKSEPVVRRNAGPERSEYPRPTRQEGDGGDDRRQGAGDVRPDPAGHGTAAALDLLDGEAAGANLAAQDMAEVGSDLWGSGDDADAPSHGILFGGQSLADEVARGRAAEQISESGEGGEDESGSGSEEPRGRAGKKMAALGRGIMAALQSILAVVFGAGLFIAFDQLWRWNPIVALVLSVLVILGLVVGVRVVRRTEDIASTLIAVAVGALITLGPMALLQTG